ncbi:MAG: dihydropteroate synthase [Coriobacteriales bacterium]|nr:dihydropteroate synthase [Coriobacteriales bacterium]
MSDSLFTWHCGSFFFEQTQPLVVGILNVTPDSFSDGGCYSNTFEALFHANSLLEAGADIIEVGGESTRPGSRELAAPEELARILPVVKVLVREGVCVSVDSRHPPVIKACLEEGAAIINDITGFTDASMRELAGSSEAGCVVMHMQGKPQTMQESPRYDDIVAEVSDFLLSQADALVESGVKRQRICLDVGPGFGKNYEQNLLLLKNTAHFANLGSPAYPLMAAWSRKRFLGMLTGEEVPAQRVAASVAAALFAASQGARVLRVHDVEPTVMALKVLNAVYE